MIFPMFEISQSTHHVSKLPGCKHSLRTGRCSPGFSAPCSISQPIDRPQTRPAQTRAKSLTPERLLLLLLLLLLSSPLTTGCQTAHGSISFESSISSALSPPG